MPKQNVKLAIKRQDANKNRYFYQCANELLQLLIQQFEYKNLPDTIDARDLERNLITGKGNCVAFFYLEAIDSLVALPASGRNVGFYGNPTAFQTTSETGFTRSLYFNVLDFDNQDSVVMYDNVMHNNYIFDTINLYASRLQDLQTIIDNHTRLAHVAPLILTTQQQLQQAQNLMDQYDRKQPAIFVDKLFDPSQVNVLEFSKQFNGPQLMALYNEVRQDALKHCGIVRDYVQNKTERSITAEVNMANSESFELAYQRLLERRKAVDLINKKFGTNIQVDFRQLTYRSEYVKPEYGGGDSDGNQGQ